jgi:hypothetical protein
MPGKWNKARGQRVENGRKNSPYSADFRSLPAGLAYISSHLFVCGAQQKIGAFSGRRLGEPDSVNGRHFVSVN